MLNTKVIINYTHTQTLMLNSMNRMGNPRQYLQCMACRSCNTTAWASQDPAVMQHTLSKSYKVQLRYNRRASIDAVYTPLLLGRSVRPWLSSNVVRGWRQTNAQTIVWILVKPANIEKCAWGNKVILGPLKKGRRNAMPLEWDVPFARSISVKAAGNWVTIGTNTWTW